MFLEGKGEKLAEAPQDRAVVSQMITSLYLKHTYKSPERSRKQLDSRAANPRTGPSLAVRLVPSALVYHEVRRKKRGKLSKSSEILVTLSDVNLLEAETDVNG